MTETKLEPLLELLPPELRIITEEYSYLSGDIVGYQLRDSLKKDNEDVAGIMFPLTPRTMSEIMEKIRDRRKKHYISERIDRKGLGSLEFHLAVLELRGVLRKTNGNYESESSHEIGRPKTRIQGFMSDLGILSPRGEPYCWIVQGIGHLVLADNIEKNMKEELKEYEKKDEEDEITKEENNARKLERAGWIKWGEESGWVPGDKDETKEQEDFILDYCRINRTKLPNWLGIR